jgi:hypothetical protein
MARLLTHDIDHDDDLMRSGRRAHRSGALRGRRAAHRSVAISLWRVVRALLLSEVRSRRTAGVVRIRAHDGATMTSSSTSAGDVHADASANPRPSRPQKPSAGGPLCGAEPQRVYMVLRTTCTKSGTPWSHPYLSGRRAERPVASSGPPGGGDWWARVRGATAGCSYADRPCLTVVRTPAAHAPGGNPGDHASGACRNSAGRHKLPFKVDFANRAPV